MSKCLPCFLLVLLSGNLVQAGELVLEIANGAPVTFVGAIQRWDSDGNHRRPVNPKAKIDQPEVSAQAKPQGINSWLFADLLAGRYDLVILAKERRRLEGFHYPPVREFDPFWPPQGKDPEEETRAKIVKDIAKGKHYENKVAALFLAGDDKQVRVLMQLVRDLPTSYDAEVGYPVATIRHEVWQYSYRFGAWSKEKATKVLDRVLLPRDELKRWTWVWEPRLGGIEVKDQPVRIRYAWPTKLNEQTARGWFPR